MIHLTFESGKYDIEQSRAGAIVDGNVLFFDYTVSPENYEVNFPIFQKVLDSLKIN